MQIEAQQPPQLVQHERYHSLKDHDQELELPLLNAQNEENLQESHDRLNKEFSRLPYKLYKFWLVLTFGFILGAECVYWKRFVKAYQEKTVPSLKNHIISAVVYQGGPLIFLFANAQMLIGMLSKKAGGVQKSLTNLQISMIFSVIVIAFNAIISKRLVFQLSLLLSILNLGVPLLSAINLIGGFVVLKAFKKNHPLARRDSSQNEDSDFVQQNRAITAEILKYDEQLDRWPYKIYKFWLGFVLILAVGLICGYILLITTEGPKAFCNIPFVCFLFLSAVGCYEMINAMRGKILARSQRAKLLLKICLPLSVIITVVQFVTMSIISLRTLVNFALQICVPLISLIGAFYVTKILEQREPFAKISNYNDDTYI